MGQLAQEARWQVGAGVMPALAWQEGQAARCRLHTSECTGGLVTPPLGAQFGNRTARKQNPKPIADAQRWFGGHLPGTSACQEALDLHGSPVDSPRGPGPLQPTP